MTEQQNKTPFVTIAEHPTKINGKEYRITINHNVQKGTYSVGIREYLTTARYTGYSSRNGVSLPAPDFQSAQMLASTFLHSLNQMGNIWESI